MPQQPNRNTYQSKQTHKTAIDDCNRQQVKKKRTPAYGKIKVDKLFRKPFCTKISHLAVQFDGEKQQIHTKPTFHRILKFHWKLQKYNKIGVSCETLPKGWKMVQKYMFHVEQFALVVVFHVKQKRSKMAKNPSKHPISGTFCLIFPFENPMKNNFSFFLHLKFY